MYSRFLKAVVKYKRQHKVTGEDGRLQRTRLTKVISRFCDYHFVIRVIVLHKLGQLFKAFHEALEKREADFTATPQQINLLRKRLIGLCSNEKLEAMRNQCTTIIAECNKIKHIRSEQRRVDAPVRLRDYDEVVALEVARETAKDIVELFEEEVEVRFPKDTCKIVSALGVLDPENFPELSGLSDAEVEAQVSAYGVEKIKVLSDFYGTPHEDSEVKPPINAEKVMDSWDSLKEFWKDNRETMPTFSTFLQKVYKKSASSSSFRNDVSEVLTLMQIADAKMSSTAENERVIRALGQVATPQRVRLSDDRIEALVKVSTEVARKFPNSPEKVLGYQQRASKPFKKLLEKKRIESRLRMEKSRQKKRSRPAASDESDDGDVSGDEASESSESQSDNEEDASDGQDESMNEEDQSEKSESNDADQESESSEKIQESESSEESGSVESFEKGSSSSSEDDIEDAEEF